MKNKLLLFSIFLFISVIEGFGQWTYPTSTEISTTDEVIAPVLRISNEIRLANTFNPLDPTLGTMDNSGYGINIHKTEGIGFAFNGYHKVTINPNGYISAPIAIIDNEVRIANTFNPIDPTIGTLDNDAYGINLSKTDGVGLAFNGNHEIVFKPNGDTGIGTSTPQGKLHISTGTAGDAILLLEADIDNNNESDNPLIQLRQDGGQGGINMGFSEENFGSNIFGIGTRYANQENWSRLVINTNTGNVGIGTITPDEKLTVKGKIHSEEVRVDLSVPAPDYVFSNDYNLKTLDEVQSYIKEQGHLPNIPSAKEMEKNGVEIGLMNMKLLEKIEELTLYIIQQEKRIQKLEKNK